MNAPGSPVPVVLLGERPGIDLKSAFAPRAEEDAPRRGVRWGIVLLVLAAFVLLLAAVAFRLRMRALMRPVPHRPRAAAPRAALPAAPAPSPEVRRCRT